MRKREEIRQPGSCLNKAGEREMVFVLLGRDVAAPAAIRAWVGERLIRGKNQIGDPQLVEAIECANDMEKDRFFGVQPYHHHGYVKNGYNGNFEIFRAGSTAGTREYLGVVYAEAVTKKIVEALNQ